MSVTAKDTDGDVLDGTPSSWSSAIDNILFNSDTKKLFCISAGNADIDDVSFTYMASNIIRITSYNVCYTKLLRV